MSWFGFGPSATAEIQFDDVDPKRWIELPKEKSGEKIPLYIGSETVKGKALLKVPPGKKVEHAGVKIELLGEIELFYDHGNHHEFASVVSELAAPGEIVADTTYPFEFLNVPKMYESYNGVNVRLRYFLRFTVLVRKSLTNLVKESDFFVHNFQPEPEINNSIKMEVGIEECLHIEFEYNKSRYHLKDVVIGKIYFLLVRIKVKHMEIALIKRESTGSGPNLYNETETITKYEIMDGLPVRGESIPIRLFLGGYDLTPTYRNVHNKFSVKYCLNLVLVDEEDRRYFKQQEITLWRKAPPGHRKKDDEPKAVAPAPARAPSAAENDKDKPDKEKEVDGKKDERK